MNTHSSGSVDFRIDFRLPGPSGDLLLEVKRTSSAVDLRGVLLSLTYVLAGEPTSRAVCVLVDTRLTQDRLQEELGRFRRTVQASLADRVFLLGIREGKVEGDLPAGDTALLPRILEAAQRESVGLRRVTQQTVKSLVLMRWLLHGGGVGVAEMARETGASFPTVTAAFRSLRQDGVVIPRGASFVLSDELPWPTVLRLAQEHAKERRVIRYADPNGLAKSPLDMARRLDALHGRGEAQEVSFGGVVGAERLYPDLDITAPPRLDLCVYSSDTSFVRQLDAGLLETSDPDDKAVLVLHMTKNPNRGPNKSHEMVEVASPVDCLADLLEIGLQAEAKDYWMGLTRQRRKRIEKPLEAREKQE